MLFVKLAARLPTGSYSTPAGVTPTTTHTDNEAAPLGHTTAPQALGEATTLTTTTILGTNAAAPLRAMLGATAIALGIATVHPHDRHHTGPTEGRGSSATTAGYVGTPAPTPSLGLRPDAAQSSPPDIRLAHHDVGGHPLFPADEAAKDDDIHGTHAGMNAGMTLPINYAENEEGRRTKAIADEAVGRKYGKVIIVLSIHTAGMWATAGPVFTFEQAVNVVRWVHRGDTFAREFLRATVTHLGTNPTLGCSIGEVALLQYQNQAMAVYKAVTLGHKLVRGKTTNAGAPAWLGLHSTGTPEARRALGANPGATEDIFMGPAVPVRAIQPVYLGSARHISEDTTSVLLKEIPDMDDTAQSGTAASIENAVLWYTKVPTAYWPHGMRVTYTELPATEIVTPWAADVGSWFTLNALASRHDTGHSSVHRTAFLLKSVYILSVHGTFDHYATVGSYMFNTLPLRRYEHILLADYMLANAARYRQGFNSAQLARIIRTRSPQSHRGGQGHNDDGLRRRVAKRNGRRPEHGTAPTRLVGQLGLRQCSTRRLNDVPWETLNGGGRPARIIARTRHHDGEQWRLNWESIVLRRTECPGMDGSVTPSQEVTDRADLHTDGPT
ncbi:hypothetical protein C8F04DRAFT_1190628 [Mycena alexandri]|uniref:Uncharacterized protein n=1 Tax=Mycena alexandri TaxID=1745969 RepID=A0AAD6SGC7_9AGAR|nr:hypothetical protein C8F04DRAFT_1190628 [Mycena alexandri]